jgi:hypothetical protein
VAQMTITEAFAELKTIQARLKKKREFIGSHLIYPDAIKDPLINDGGTLQVVQREQQAIRDLQERLIRIRSAMQEANLATTITIDGTTRSIAAWLAWRKDLQGGERDFLNTVRRSIDNVRTNVRAKGDDPAKAVIVNIDEGDLGARMETLEKITSTLDGQLSLKNATVVIEVPD